MDFKDLAFFYFDKAIAAIVVVVALWAGVSALRSEQTIRAQQEDINDLIQDVETRRERIAPPPVEEPPRLEQLVSSFIDVPDGVRFREGIFHRPGEVSDEEGVEVKLGMDTVVYDYNEPFEKAGLKPEEAPEIIEFVTGDAKVAKLTIDQEAQPVTVHIVPVGEGSTWGRLVFASDRILHFQIDVTKIEQRYLLAPVIDSVIPSPGSVEIVWRAVNVPVSAS